MPPKGAKKGNRNDALPRCCGDAPICLLGELNIFVVCYQTY